MRLMYTCLSLFRVAKTYMYMPSEQCCQPHHVLHDREIVQILPVITELSLLEFSRVLFVIQVLPVLLFPVVTRLRYFCL